MKHLGLIIVVVVGAGASIIQPELIPFALAAIAAYEVIK